MKVSASQRLIVNMALEETHVPLMLVGEMGIGKSWSVKDAAEIVNAKLRKRSGLDKEDKTRLFYCIDLRLATQEPGDIIGMPRVEVKPELDADGNYIYFDTIDEKGDEIKVLKTVSHTVWTLPEWWPKAGTRGILFLDELNRAPIDVRQAIFQLVTEWRLHTHKMPDGWIIVSAINPDSGDYQVETLDKAMSRRFCQVKISPDTRDWLRWAEDYGINDRIQKFIRENQKFLYIEGNFEIAAWPTPEGYRMVDELLDAEVIPNDEGAKFETIAGLVGSEAAAELAMYLEHDVENCISADEILDGYDALADKVQSQSHDRMNKTIEEFVVRFEKRGVPGSKLALKNFVEFVKDLAAEYKTMLVMSLADNKELIVKMGQDRELKKQLINIRKKANDED